MTLRYLGLMSGTSLDGIDAALVRIEESGDAFSAKLEAFRSTPYSEEQRTAIRAALGADASAARICRLDMELGEWFAVAALELLAAAELSATALQAVGSHGQTVWHAPPDARRSGATLQLGEAAVIAERLGVPVVSDFRVRDVAAGGHGAPLVPLVDELLFRAPDNARALQNIGGIANVTLLPPAGGGPPVAFDTGPGVAVIDAVTASVSDGAERYDVEGRRAARGRPSEELLGRLLDDPFLRRPPPRSTGRERYGDEYAGELIRAGRQLGLGDDDLVATATALTARTIAEAYRRWSGDAPPTECFVSGGGARNPTLMRMLGDALPIPVRDLSALGWDPDAKEAAAFAILAYLFERGEPGNLPSVTGARGPRVLGKLSPA